MAGYIRSLNDAPIVGKWIGKALRPFDRAYTTAENFMRHDAFYREARAKGPNWTPQEETGYGSLVNIVSGRGDLGRASSLEPYLRATFISPRNTASQWQVFLTPFTGPSSVRMAAAKSLAAQTASLAAFALLVNANTKRTQMSVETDPGKPGFMWFRYKNTRFDLTAGRSQVIRTVWRMIDSGIDYSRWGKAKYKQDTPTEIFTQYLGRRVAPGWQAIKQAGTLKDFKGDTITDKELIQSILMPWNAQDIKEAWETDGAGLGITAGISNFLGVGTQSYKDKPKRGFGPSAPRVPRLKAPSLR
jgi:hypothetical protein